MSGTPDGIDCLESHVAALTAENAKLRAAWGHDLDAAISREDALRLDLARATEESASHWQVACDLSTDLNAAGKEITALRLDLARVTEDTARRCSELRTKLAALRAAGQAVVDTFEPDDPLTEPTYNTPRGDARAALRAALAIEEE